MRISPALRCKQNPWTFSAPFRGRPLGLFGAVCSAVALGTGRLPFSDRAPGSSRNARQSTPRAPARATPAEREGFRRPGSRRPVPEDGGTCQARRPPQGGGGNGLCWWVFGPAEAFRPPRQREPSGPFRVPKKGNNAQEDFHPNAL